MDFWGLPVDVRTFLRISMLQKMRAAHAHKAIIVLSGSARVKYKGLSGVDVVKAAVGDRGCSGLGTFGRQYLYDLLLSITGLPATPYFLTYYLLAVRLRIP